MKLHYRTLFFLICGIVICNGCRKDTYDPNALGKDYFIQDIPENFTWATTSSVDIEIIPYDRYNGQYPYRIEIFDKNPLLDNSPALYASGWCTMTNPWRKTITLPDIQTTLYIRQTSPGGRRSMLEATIENGQVTGNFSPVPASGTTGNKIVLTDKKPVIPEEVPEDAEEISGTRDAISLSPGKNYVIRKNYTGKIIFPGYGKGCSLYITGTWTNTGELTLLGNNENLYILESGKLLSRGLCKFQFSPPAAFVYVSPGGQLGDRNENNITLQFQNYGILQNEGQLYCNEITSESKGMTVLNKGQFYANRLKSGDSHVFENECFAKIQEVILVGGSEIDIASGCSFVCTTLSMINSFVYLDDGAMLQADKLTTSDQGQNNVKRTGNEKEPALVRLLELSCPYSEKPTIIFHKNIHVDCRVYPQNSKTYKILSTYGDPASGPAIDIPKSECNQGNDYIPEKPEKPQFPVKVTYNQSYTYASEDNFPSPGDFDMNDLVIGMDSISYYYVKDDDDDAIGKMIFHMTLRAVGATRQLGAAIQFDELEPEDIKSVSYSKNVPLKLFKLDGRGTEKDQKHAVIPLFDNAHHLLGCDNTTTLINTISNKPEWIYNVPPCSFDVSIEFSSPVDEDDVELEELNFFTIVGTRTKDRTEIHLPRYKHTQLSSTPENYQQVTDKYMWTIRVPGNFRYPHEWEKITTAYPEFEDWVKSNRTQHRDWYNHPNSNYLYSK